MVALALRFSIRSAIGFSTGSTIGKGRDSGRGMRTRDDTRAAAGMADYTERASKAQRPASRGVLS